MIKESVKYVCMYIHIYNIYKYIFIQNFTYVKYIKLSHFALQLKPCESTKLQLKKNKQTHTIFETWLCTLLGKWDKLPVPQFLNLSGKDNIRIVKISKK